VQNTRKNLDSDANKTLVNVSFEFHKPYNMPGRLQRERKQPFNLCIAICANPLYWLFQSISSVARSAVKDFSN